MVTASEPRRDFAFGVGARDKPLNTWRYVLAPAADGTDVTESFELTPLPLLRLYWAVLGLTRGPTNINGMRTTLDRIKAIAEAPSG